MATKEVGLLSNVLTFSNNCTVKGEKVQHTSTVQLCLSMQNEVRAASVCLKYTDTDLVLRQSTDLCQAHAGKTEDV